MIFSNFADVYKRQAEREKVAESTAFGLEIKIEYAIVGKTAFVFIFREENTGAVLFLQRFHVKQVMQNLR